MIYRRTMFILELFILSMQVMYIFHESATDALDSYSCVRTSAKRIVYNRHICRNFDVCLTKVSFDQSAVTLLNTLIVYPRISVLALSYLADHQLCIRLPRAVSEFTHGIKIEQRDLFVNHGKLFSLLYISFVFLSVVIHQYLLVYV